MTLPGLLGHILLNNILPIFLAIGAGYLLARSTPLDASTLSKSVLYIFSPCLVYSLLTSADIEAAEASRIVIVSVGNVIISGALAWGVSRLIGLGRVMTTALMMVTMFPNAGNYGLALNQIAFGSEALARAVIFFVTNSVLFFTAGIYLVSRGRLTAREALKSLFSIPPIYAIIVALGSVATGISLPSPALTIINILGDASIPVMLILLGTHVARGDTLKQMRLAGLASGLRLVVGAGIALALAALFGLSGAARQASVVEASMPTAVIVTAAATEFDVEPGFVTSSVVLSTLLSPITVTVLIALLR